jgi:hypothetical protein
MNKVLQHTCKLYNRNVFGYTDKKPTFWCKCTEKCFLNDKYVLNKQYIKKRTLKKKHILDSWTSHRQNEPRQYYCSSKQNK